MSQPGPSRHPFSVEDGRSSSSSQNSSRRRSPSVNSDAESGASRGSKRPITSKRSRESRSPSPSKGEALSGSDQTGPSSPARKRQRHVSVEERQRSSTLWPRVKRKATFIPFEEPLEDKRARIYVVPPDDVQPGAAAQARKRARAHYQNGVDLEGRALVEPPSGQGIYFNEVWRERGARRVTDMPLWCLALRSGHMPRAELEAAVYRSPQFHKSMGGKRVDYVVKSASVIDLQNGKDVRMFKATPYHRYPLRRTPARAASIRGFCTNDTLNPTYRFYEDYEENYTSYEWPRARRALRRFGRRNGVTNFRRRERSV